MEVNGGTAMCGKVSRYFQDRRYGFIMGNDGKTYFVHCSKLYGERLETGYYVYFVPYRTERSEYNAKHVSVIEVPEQSDFKGNKRKRNVRKHKSCNADRMMNDNKNFNRFARRFMAEQKNRNKQQEEV